MRTFTLTQWSVIIILSLLTALEPLCIDLYLPGFIMISEAFGTHISAVQMSLSTFLAGFAIGQLFWGPLADRLGRKKPILISLFVFIIASVACIYVKTIEQLWVVRFIQAIGGCGGVVISRAVVTDYFDKNKTLKIFSILALIMGIAPIIAPSIGNGVLQFFSWKGLFGAMLVLGIILFLLTFFLLPETHKNRKRNNTNIIKDYWSVLKVKKFTIYAIIAGLANGALMIYVSNGPFIIMENGGFSSTAFGFLFAINALGLMIGSYLINILQKYFSLKQIVNHALLFMSLMGILLITFMSLDLNIVFILITLFFYVFPIGILFPATTELALSQFRKNSGTASALFGSIQLLLSSICSLLANYMNNATMISVGIALLFCCILGLIIIFGYDTIRKTKAGYFLKLQKIRARA